MESMEVKGSLIQQPVYVLRPRNKITPLVHRALTLLPTWFLHRLSPVPPTTSTPTSPTPLTLPWKRSATLLTDGAGGGGGKKLVWCQLPARSLGHAQDPPPLRAPRGAANFSSSRAGCKSVLEDVCPAPPSFTCPGTFTLLKGCRPPALG